MDPTPLALKQRSFLKRNVESGNGTESALVAYDTQDPGTAHAIATEHLQEPTIRRAVEVLLDAEA